LWGIYGIRLLRAELKAAYELAEILLRLAQESGDPALLLHAQSGLGFAVLQMGDLQRARKCFEAVVSSYDPARDHKLVHRFSGADIGVGGLTYLSLVLSALGYPEAALRRMREAMTLAEAVSHPLSLHFALFFVGLLHEGLRDPIATQRSAERLIALYAEDGFTANLPSAIVQLGWSLSQQGRYEEGLAQMKEGLATLRAARFNLGHPGQLSLLIGPCLEAGALDDAADSIAMAVTMIEEHEDRSAEAEIHRLNGELLLRQQRSNQAAAQRCFERAIRVARTQSAKSLELRATTSLARLLASQGHRDEARTILGEIYNWFTEGFDTADLKDAKALLDELTP
jgi:predicted ATPase